MAAGVCGGRPAFFCNVGVGGGCRTSRRADPSEVQRRAWARTVADGVGWGEGWDSRRCGAREALKSGESDLSRASARIQANARVARPNNCGRGLEGVKWKAGNTIMWVRAGVGAHADEGGGGKMDAASHEEIFRVLIQGFELGKACRGSRETDSCPSVSSSCRGRRLTKKSRFAGVALAPAKRKASPPHAQHAPGELRHSQKPDF